MHVERDLLCVCGPMLVAEAVRVSAVHVCRERVVAGGYAALVDLVCVGRVLDLLDFRSVPILLLLTSSD